MAEQSFEKHSRYLPGYHFVMFPILLINVFVAFYAAYSSGFSGMGIWNVMLSIALVLLGWYARVMPLTAQNRDQTRRKNAFDGEIARTPPQPRS